MHAHMIPSEISEITESSDTTCHCRSGVLIISECKMKLASNPYRAVDPFRLSLGHAGLLGGLGAGLYLLFLL
jgi:hypothetical protein